MSNPLLSICISTYNRANYIGDTLISIIPQLDDDIELLVIDGASTDNTEYVVQNFAQKEPRIRYIRLPTKGGIDHDYNKAVEFAHGKYCWLFTDDDLLKPGAVAKVKAAIGDGYSLIIVNAEVRDRSLSDVLQSRRMLMRENKIYASNAMESLFTDSLPYLSFIGAVVIDRNIWLSRKRRIYFGTEFIHVGVIFQNPLPGPTLIVAEPYISIRLHNAQWEPRRFEIWMFKWPKLIWSFKNIDKEAKNRITPKEPWRKFKQLILHRSLGSYSVRYYRSYFSAIKANFLWKYCAWAIACFPKFIIHVILYLYSFMKPEFEAFFYCQFSKQKK